MFLLYSEIPAVNNFKTNRILTPRWAGPAPGLKGLTEISNTCIFIFLQNCDSRPKFRSKWFIKVEFSPIFRILANRVCS